MSGSVRHPIKRQLLRKLPAWFQRENYSRARGFDALDWYGQRAIRRICSAHLCQIRESEPIISKWDEPVRQALAILRTGPICDLTRPPFDREPFAFCCNVGSSGSPVVGSMTRRDLYSLDQAVRKVLNRDQIDQAQRMAGDLSPGGVLRFALSPAEWMG